ncbi:MAG: RpiB/LacA/LacB family sugar-phosphate isomerase [Phycisphaerales bacterium]
MIVGIAADHGGFELKRELTERLQKAGHTIRDFGDNSNSPQDDYPDYVIPLSRAVATGTVERGIAICGSGVGAAICANKVAGVRASLIHDHFSAKQGVEDDHMNVLCLGGRTTGVETAWDVAQAFLEAQFSSAERHLRRIAKVAALSASPKN